MKAALNAHREQEAASKARASQQARREQRLRRSATTPAVKTAVDNEAGDGGPDEAQLALFSWNESAKQNTLLREKVAEERRKALAMQKAMGNASAEANQALHVVTRTH